MNRQLHQICIITNSQAKNIDTDTIMRTVQYTLIQIKRIRTE